MGTESACDIARRILFTGDANVDAHALIIVDRDPWAESDCASQYRLRSLCTEFPSSAGVLALGHSSAHLWLDGRYYHAGAQWCAGRGIVCHRYERDNEWAEWLHVHWREFAGDEYEAGDGDAGDVRMRIGCDAQTTTCADFDRWGALIAEPWELVECRYDWAALHEAYQVAKHAHRAYFIIPAEYCDRSARAKIDALRAEVDMGDTEYVVHTDASELSWLFNIRGWDALYNHIVYCGAIIGADSCRLYVDEECVDGDTRASLTQHGVQIASLGQLYADVDNMPAGSVIHWDARSTRRDLMSHIAHYRHAAGQLAVWEDKYYKSEREVAAIRAAALEEGVTLVNFVCALRHRIRAGGALYERDVGELLAALRRERASFLQESFPSIIAYSENAALIHYQYAGRGARIKPRGILLVDCGGHYRYATTDIARVFVCGEARETGASSAVGEAGTASGARATGEMDAMSEAVRADYTAVLRAHIRGAMARFPLGSNGAQLDAIVRSALWEHGLDYEHGTGHSIGLCHDVHEGARGLSRRATDTILKPGFVFSNEPGVYRIGEYGIRLENMAVVRTDATDAADTRHAGQFCHVETLSLFPFERVLIDSNMLTVGEREWLNGYHRHVYDMLSSHLGDEQKRWLAEQTAPL